MTEYVKYIRKRARELNKILERDPSPVFYVYVLLDPRKPGKFTYDLKGHPVTFDHEPFYVGKGCGKRMFLHEREAEAREGTKAKRNEFKLNLIRKLLRLGMRPITLQISDCAAEAVAMAKEELLISVVGRRDRGKGPLVNAMDGGIGGRGSTRTPEQRKKISDKLKGRVFTAEHIERNRQAQLNRDPSEAQIEALRALHAGNVGRKHSEDTKEKRRKALTGVKHSSERIANMRAALNNLGTLTCPHCGKTGGLIGMKHWHFDNCRLAQNQG